METIAIKPIIEKCSYEVPYFMKTENGLEQAKCPFNFIPADGQLPNDVPRGFEPETIAAVLLKYLRDNNVDELVHPNRSKAIQKLSEVTELLITI